MRAIRDDDVTHIILHDVIISKNVMKAEQKLLALSGLKKYMDKLSNHREMEWFRRHLRKYIQIYLPDCPFEVTTTNRYTITNHEAAVCARRFIKKGQEIKYLSGTLVAMTREEEKDLDLSRKDFSIVMSSRRKTPSLFLGPARFANHDCGANGRLMTRGPEGMQVVATRDIFIGEEITVSYGDDYFGIDNCECLCSTCEQAVRNGWAPRADTEVPVDPSASILGLGAPADSHTSPSKRKFDYDSDTSDSPTPVKRGKFERQGSKLKSELSASEIADTADSASDVTPKPSTDSQSEVKDTEHGGTDDVLKPNATNIEPTQPHVSTDCESPISLTAESQRSSASTAITSVCDTGIKIKNEETVPTQGDEAAPTEELKPAVLSAAASQQDTDLRWVGSDADVLSDLSDSFELDDNLGTVVRRKRRPRGSRWKQLIRSVEGESHGCRVPGDYTKTPKLLAQRYDRWVECNTCSAWFVQHNSYLTRRECPRCERHSMLYGFQWPKTDKEGPKDDEERVMDHRTVHRFLYPEEEAQISRRGRGVSNDGTPTTDLSDRRAETEESEVGDDRRSTRSTRRRTRGLRMTM